MNLYDNLKTFYIIIIYYFFFCVLRIRTMKFVENQRNESEYILCACNISIEYIISRTFIGLNKIYWFYFIVREHILRIFQKNILQNEIKYMP